MGAWRDIIYGLFCLLPFASLWAQPEVGLPFMELHEPKEYQAHEQNWGIVQAENGLLYVGNSAGVVLEYDGADWRKIPIANQSIVRSLAHGADSRVYVGAVGEIGRLMPDKKTQQLVYQSLIHLLPPEKRDFGSVWAMVTDEKSIFFQTREYIFRYFFEQDSLVSYTPTKPENVFFELWNPHGRILVHELGSGLYELDSEKGFLRIAGSQVLASHRIYTMLPLPEGRILLGAKDQGLYIFNPTAPPERRFTQPPEWEALRQRLIQSGIYHGTHLQDGNLLLASDHNGVFLASSRGEILQHINESTGLPSDFVLYTFQDKKGKVHLGTDEGIVTILSQLPITRFEKSNGLDGAVLDIIRFRGTLYVATFTGFFRLRGQQFERIEGIDYALWQLKVHRGRLYGASDEGVFDLTEAAPRRIFDNGHNYTFSLQFFEHYPDYFLATERDGVLVFHRENGSWKMIKKITIPHTEIRKVYQAADGTIWLASAFKGVVRLENLFENGKLNENPEITHFDTAQGLPKNNWIHLAEVGRDMLFGTKGGLYRFDKETQRFTPDTLRIENFTPERDIHYLAKDTAGNLWMGGMNPNAAGPGVALRQPDGTYRWERQPLQQIGAGALYTIFPDSNGVIWMGGTKGLYRYEPSRSRLRTISPCMVRTVIAGGDSVLFTGAGLERLPDLPFSLNELTFRFAAPDFERGAQYRYFLEGQDEGWSAWQESTQKQYTNLPERHYKLHLQAKNVYGNVSPVRVLSFRILPPWYRRWWAYTSYVVGFLLLLWLLIRLNTLRLLRHQQYLEEAIRDRTKKLHQANKNLAKTNAQLRELDRFKESLVGMIVHDLKNPLNTIIAQTTSLKERPEGSRIRQAGQRMLNLVMNILDVQRLEHTEFQLVRTVSSVKGLLEQAFDQVQLLADSKHLEVRIEAQQGLAVHADRQLTERVLVNLLTNAIKYSPLNAQVHIRVRPLGEEARFEVIDKGTGIPKEDQETIFEQFSQNAPRHLGVAGATGIGLTFCKLVVEAHGGQIGVVSEVGKGSTFWFVLPVATLSVEQLKSSPVDAPKEKEVKKEGEWNEAMFQKVVEVTNQLQQLEVYEATRIARCLLVLESSPYLPVKKWKKEVEKAVFSCNELRYSELLNEIKNEYTLYSRR